MRQSRKRRGVQLTLVGIKAVQDQLDRENLSYDDLAERAFLSVDTIRRLLSKQSVDRTSVIAIARALNLRLTDIVEFEQESLPLTEPAKPEFIINDAFYVERTGLETQGYETLSKPGALLRIKAPQKMGKTALMVKILSQLRQQQSYRIAVLSFELADRSVFGNLKDFSKWFCAAVSTVLEVENQLEYYWEDILACNFNTTNYFQKCLLDRVDTPLVLALDNTDLVFEHTDIATDFCKLLRSWHDQARRGDVSSQVWQKLRLVIVHATEVYGPLDINTSPLAGAGVVIDLPEFDLRQTQTLAQQYKLEWSVAEIVELMNLIGGHPYLLQKAFEAAQRHPLHQIIEEAATEAGIYRDHLRQLLNMLEQSLALIEAFRSVVMAESPTQMKPAQAFKLYSMGLVMVLGNKVKPRCLLYREYFKGYFGS